MILFVTLETDALGTVSHDHYSVSPDQVDRGIYVNALFPNSYGSFVKAIHVQSVDGGEAVQITSQYGSRKYSAYEHAQWESGSIGLSYASCKVFISLVPKYMPTWDILTVEHEGAILVFQREDIVAGAHLGTVRPRVDGSQIPWLDTRVEFAGDDRVMLSASERIMVVLGGEPVVSGEETYELCSFSTIVYEWDDLENKPVKFIVDTQDLTASAGDAEAALRVADSIEEQQPEMLEIVARYMEHAADLGSEEALTWLRDYHEVDDSRHHPYV